MAGRYDYVELDEYVVMPNHLHGILIIRPGGGDRSRPVPTGKAKTKSLSKLIGVFKTTSSKRIREGGLAYFQWQRSFHDHVLRDDEDLNRIREYIRENPARWELDEESGEGVRRPGGMMNKPRRDRPPCLSANRVNAEGM